jgi:hypothetical protein
MKCISGNVGKPAWNMQSRDNFGVGNKEHDKKRRRTKDTNWNACTAQQFWCNGCLNFRRNIMDTKM